MGFRPVSGAPCMQIRFSQLKDVLNRSECRVFLVSGDEPYQHMLAADMYREHLSGTGFTDRKILTSEPGFDWSGLDAARHDRSLFGERTLVDLRIPGGKPGASGSKAIAGFLQGLHPDVALLIQAPRLDRSAMGSAWVKAVDKAGVIVRVWPLNYRETENWVRQKLRKEGFAAGKEVVALIAQHVEGNLVAGVQELEKIVLVSDSRELTLESVSRVLTDSSHYSLKELNDTLSTRDHLRCIRILRGLEKEDVQPPLVLWAMAERVRMLAGRRGEARDHRNPGGSDRLAGVTRTSLQHVSLPASTHGQEPSFLLRQCAWVDQVIKGQAHGNPWRELVQLGLAIQLAG